MKRFAITMLLGLGGCATAPPAVQVPVPVQVPCPAPIIPPKPDLSALAALKPTDPPQRVIEVMVSAIKELATDDLGLRALMGAKP